MITAISNHNSSNYNSGFKFSFYILRFFLLVPIFLFLYAKQLFEHFSIYDLLFIPFKILPTPCIAVSFFITLILFLLSKASRSDLIKVL